MEKDKLLPCPFCGGEVEYHEDDYGGSWVSHKIKHKNGSLDPCILTGSIVDFQSQHGANWNSRQSPSEGLTLEAIKNVLWNYIDEPSELEKIMNDIKKFATPPAKGKLNREEIETWLDECGCIGFSPTPMKRSEKGGYYWHDFERLVDAICAKFSRPEVPTVDAIADAIMDFHEKCLKEMKERKGEYDFLNNFPIGGFASAIHDLLKIGVDNAK